MVFIARSISSDKRANTDKSGPLTLIPIGVLMPVDNISIRVFIGKVQALARPGNFIAASISFISSWMVFPGSGHCSMGLRRMIVSIIASGAESVAVSARPTFPNTDTTSGKVLIILSVCCNNSLALVMEIPGKVVGIYNISPSFNGGMNSDPTRDNG